MALAQDGEDPWKLGSSAAKKDWREMRSPPLEMFAWKRVVTDEFTYLDCRDREVHGGTWHRGRLWCMPAVVPVWCMLWASLSWGV